MMILARISTWLWWNRKFIMIIFILIHILNGNLSISLRCLVTSFRFLTTSIWWYRFNGKVCRSYNLYIWYQICSCLVFWLICVVWWLLGINGLKMTSPFFFLIFSIRTRYQALTWRFMNMNCMGTFCWFIMLNWFQSNLSSEFTYLLQSVFHLVISISQVCMKLYLIWIVHHTAWRFL